MSRQSNASNLGRRRFARRGLRAACVATALAVVSLAPTAAQAADVDDDMDGRFVGYVGGKQVAMESRATTLTYLAFFGLAVIGCVPLFKAAKRD